jgi:hypothetical protein
MGCGSFTSKVSNLGLSHSDSVGVAGLGHYRRGVTSKAIDTPNAYAGNKFRTVADDVP